MIDFQDEVLNGEPKYRILDENGNVIYDKVTIEMITELLQVGTPLNKALFDKINSRLCLINKYNNPDMIIENSTNHLNINFSLNEYDEKQIIKLCITPTEYEEFTSNIFPTFSSENYLNGFKTSTPTVFNNDISGGITGNEKIEAIIQCPVSIIPSNVSVVFYHASNSSTNITLEASRDGIEWEILKLDTVNSINTTTKTYTIDTEKAYTYFKTTIVGGIGTYGLAGIYDFKITSGKKSKFNESYSSKLSVGFLDEKNIIGVPTIFKNCELIYENDEFILQ